MKKLIYISTFLTLTLFKVNAQESIFFFKKDTIFITYDTSMLNPFVLKEYKKSINHKTKKNIGVSTTYNLLDKLEINRKLKQLKYIKEQYELGYGSTAGLSNYFGLYFIHGTVKNKIRNIKEDPTYKIFKKHHLKRDIVTYSDSLAFDTFVFHNLFRRYKYANTSLLFSEEELKNKRVIHFDGSTKAYNDLKELSKEPVYIYVLEKKIEKKVVVKLGEKSNQKENGLFYLFNEVSLKRLPKVM